MIKLYGVQYYSTIHHWRAPHRLAGQTMGNALDLRDRASEIDPVKRRDSLDRPVLLYSCTVLGRSLDAKETSWHVMYCTVLHEKNSAKGRSLQGN